MLRPLRMELQLCITSEPERIQTRARGPPTCCCLMTAWLRNISATWAALVASSGDLSSRTRMRRGKLQAGVQPNRS